MCLWTLKYHMRVIGSYILYNHGGMFLYPQIELISSSTRIPSTYYLSELHIFGRVGVILGPWIRRSAVPSFMLYYCLGSSRSFKIWKEI